MERAHHPAAVRSDNELDDPRIAEVVQQIVAGLQPDFARLNRAARELREARERLRTATRQVAL